VTTVSVRRKLAATTGDVIRGDGIFRAGLTTRCAIDEAKNRPIVVDSRWNVVESESRDLLLKISSRNFCRSAVRIARRDQKKLCQKFNALA
jgi:hypothetical protein